MDRSGARDGVGDARRRVASRRPGGSRMDAERECRQAMSPQGASPHDVSS